MLATEGILIVKISLFKYLPPRLLAREVYFQLAFSVLQRLQHLVYALQHEAKITKSSCYSKATPVFKLFTSDTVLQ